ncbi:MAG: mechanosensitive ion channel family protein [Bacteroidales bacterium]|nr:mechanosensitive ion channel family protein [Bacteroidales bacterium]
MSEFFEKTFYGNTIAEWSIAFLIILGTFILAKAIYWLSGNIIKKITKKTKSKLDDLIIDKIEEPVILALVLGGIWYAVSYLNVSEGFAHFADKAFYVAFTFDVSWLVVRLVDSILVEYLSPLVKKTKGSLDDQLMPIVRKSLKALIWAMAIVIGLNNAGYDVGALLAGLGLGGLAFAMAAKDSVANLFGGVTVFMDKPFKIGDRIVIDGYDGTVFDMGLRSTKLRTLAGRTVTIPNKNFTEKYIENISSEPSRKMNITLGLNYETTPDDIKKGTEILKMINEKCEYTQNNCVVYFQSFGDFSLNISFTYYILSKPDYWFLAPNEINLQILQKFNQAGLDFAFPTQTILTQEIQSN